MPLDRLMEAMSYDKKVADGCIRFILPRGLGAAEIVTDVSQAMIRESWEMMFASGGDG